MERTIFNSPLYCYADIVITYMLERIAERQKPEYNEKTVENFLKEASEWILSSVLSRFPARPRWKLILSPAF